MMDFAAARRTMIENQLRTYDVLDYTTLEAMGAVPREVFLPPERQAMAYLDLSVPIAKNRAMMTPMVLGRLLQALDIKKNDKVLDVASGNGYSAAVLARYSSHVTTLEADAVLVQKIKDNLAACAIGDIAVVQGAVTAGSIKDAPFDVIFLNGAVDLEPTDLLKQLSEGGRLGVILGQGRSGRAVVYRRTGTHFTSSRIFDAAAEPLPEFAKSPEFHF